MQVSHHHLLSNNCQATPSKTNNATELDPVFPEKVKGDDKNPDVSLQINTDKPLENGETHTLGILKKSESRGTKPFYLTFKDIFYQIPIEKNKTKIILNNVSGYFKSGEVTAIMGPSGCGKTSILNFITNRIEFPHGAIHRSKLYINSEEITTEEISNYSSYVMQDDVMVDVLTPVETLKFISKLKSIQSEEEHDKKVEEFTNLKN